MPYTITRSDGVTTQEIQDSVIDTTKYSIGVVGKSTRGYGQSISQGMVRLLENFANTTSPTNPIPGQLWFDTSTGYMRYNTGSSDHENTWTKIVSADSANNIGSSGDPYNTFYVSDINDPTYVGSNTTTVYATNVGSSSSPITNSYFTNIGSVVFTSNQLVAENIDSVSSIGSSSVPVNDMFSVTIGSSLTRVSNLYVDNLDGINVDATELGGQLPSYYLDYNNFTNIPNYTSAFVNVTGDTITGNLTMSGSSLFLDHDPISNNEAATKQYIDILSSGLYFKDSCRAATTTNITLSGTQTIDGVSLLVGDRVLVKNQSTASQNGIYDVAAGAWTRSTDADGSPSSEVTSGMSVLVTEGTVNMSTVWLLVTQDPITVDVTNLTFIQTTSAATYYAGIGLILIGTQLNTNFGTSAGTISEGNHTHTNATVSVDGFMSATDKTKLDGIASGAEVNQNTFSSVAVSGQNTVVADLEEDTLTFVAGSGIIITTNAGADSMTITNSAPNINQNINAGTGLSGGGSGASVTLNNTDGGSSQNIFKNILSDSGTAVSDNNNDTLSILGTGGITTSASGNTITVDGSGVGGGSIVDSSYSVAGGYVTFSGGLTFSWGRENSGTVTLPVSLDALYSWVGTAYDTIEANEYMWTKTDFTAAPPFTTIDYQVNFGIEDVYWQCVGFRNGF